MKRIVILFAAGVLGLGAIVLAASMAIAEGALHRPPLPASAGSESIPEGLAARAKGGANSVTVQAADGITLSGWWLAPENRSPAVLHPPAAVIVLHGIGDTRKGASGHAGYLLDAGYFVLLPDSRAHGKSGGEMVTYGLLEREDVRRWVVWIRRQGIEQVYEIGVSMGAATLLQSLHGARFQAVVAESPFSCFPEIARQRVFGLRAISMSALLYAKLRYGFDLAAACPETTIREDGGRTPVLLIHGTDDLNIPIAHSRRLRYAASIPLPLWEVKGAGHVEALSRAYAEYTHRVLRFFAENSGPRLPAVSFEHRR